MGREKGGRGSSRQRFFCWGARGGGVVMHAHLIKMEYQVELAYILKRTIQCLYKDLNSEEVAPFYISDNNIPSPPCEKRKKIA
jgi:hypothetical protein